jgi:hypothetical protein
MVSNKVTGRLSCGKAGLFLGFGMDITFASFHDIGISGNEIQHIQFSLSVTVLRERFLKSILRMLSRPGAFLLGRCLNIRKT